LKKKGDSVEVSTDYEHQRAKHYLTQELKQLLNNTTTKMIASKHQQNPLTIPCGRRPRKLNWSRNLLHHLGHHKELAQEATSKKHTLLLNT
jgi:hypothetical protein